jgi:CRP/FNR family cyclic AMP-dependent transcriptional regulator
VANRHEQPPGASDSRLTDRVEALRKVPLFDGLSTTDFESLATVVAPLPISPGECIVRAGQSSDEMYFVVSGSAEVIERGSSGGSPRVGRVQPGDYFGEIGLLTSQPRTADVVATEPMQVLRLRRADYLKYLSVRTNVHAQVAASAAQRTRASLRRLTEIAALPSTYDLLLTKLVDNEIDTMRAAEVRGDPISFDEVLDFYGSTRFLYPAKLGVLESRFAAVRATWEGLIGANNEIFKILILRRVVDGRLVSKNSICAFEYALGTWQVQHLVSADRHERSGTLAALIGMTDWLWSRRDVQGIRLTYRPDNPGTNRLFGELASMLSKASSLEVTCDYHVIDCAGSGSAARGRPTDWEIRPASDANLSEVTALAERTHLHMPSWLALQDAECRTLGAKYERHGLERTRSVLVATRNGRVAGMVNCWQASEGVNFSFLENAIADLTIDTALTVDERKDVVAALLSSAVAVYRARGRSHAVALLNQTDRNAVQAAGFMPPAEKQYVTLMFDHSEAPTARKHFLRHYTRILRNEAGPPRASVGDGANGD